MSGAGNGGGTGLPVPCTGVGDCDGALGAPPAGRVWTCCAGRCDTELEQSGGCYTGSDATLDVGVCKAGWRHCSGGNRCFGERTPSAESCNGLDDDCNGSVDDIEEVTCGVGACAVTVAACSSNGVAACVPGAPLASVDGCDGIDEDCDGAIDEDCSPCVRVAPNGDDAAAAANPAQAAFRNVQVAIDYAATNPGFSTRVCVAGGPTCGDSATYPGPNGSDLTMRNGISVLGNYESTGFSRCSTPTTWLEPTTAVGVLFPSDVASPTVLDGFQIYRATFATTTAVTVDGATGVVLSNLGTASSPRVTNSYGVSVINGGDALIFRSRIDGGAGRDESIGVRAVRSRVSVEDACRSVPDDTTGRCAANCWASGSSFPGPSVHGAVTWTTTSYGVLLDDAPGSRIERSTICGGLELQAFDQDDPASVAAVRVSGDATGVLIRANNVEAAGDLTEYGHRGRSIWMEGCTDGSPRIADNSTVLARFVQRNDPPSSAVYALGACDAVVDGNASVVAYSDSTEVLTTAVACGSEGGRGSRCVVEGNAWVYATAVRSRPAMVQDDASGIGVSCVAGSCARIVRNAISGMKSYSGMRDTIRAYNGTGIVLDGAGPFIARNVIEGGCALGGTSIGVRATNSFARLENNEIVSTFGACDTSTLRCERFSRLMGLDVTSGAGDAELDVHSNFFGGPTYSSLRCIGCSGAGVSLSTVSGSPPDGPRGIFVNNVVDAGCRDFDQAVVETSAAADPRVLDHNSLTRHGDIGEAFIYMDEGQSLLSFASEVNALTDATIAGNIDGCAYDLTSTRFVPVPGDPSCIDTGATFGAPADDIDGEFRDQTPDIGPNEL